LIAKRKSDIEEKWIVTGFNNSHNHELLDEKRFGFFLLIEHPYW